MKMKKATKENNNSSGNTNLAKSFKLRSKNFIMTLNEKTLENENDIIKYVQHYKNFQYVLITEHDKPQKHHHLFVQYNNTIALDSRYLYGAHIEKSYGSAQQNVNYLLGLDDKHQQLGINCTKIYEYGEIKQRGGRRIKDILEATDEDLLDYDINMINSINKIRPPKKTKIGEWSKKIKVIYIWGPSGVGKSSSVEETLSKYEFNEFSEVKHINGFWHGIGGFEMTGAAVYDDFRDSHMTASEFINFIDYRIHNLNYKGGSTKNKFELIIITTIQNPKNIYRNVQGEAREQWMRRMEIIELKNHTNQDDKFEYVLCEDDHDGVELNEHGTLLSIPDQDFEAIL